MSEELTPEQNALLLKARARLRLQEQQPEASFGQPKTVRDFVKNQQAKEAKNAGDTLAGFLRGAGAIGSTILWPADKFNDLTLDPLPNGKSRNKQRRADIDAGLAAMGADPTSWRYKGGKLGGEVAGTAGMGGALAQGASKIPVLAQNAPNFINALRTGGFAPGPIIPRMVAGGVTGGAMTGLVEPENAGQGAMFGAAAPPVVASASKIGNALADKILRPTARKLMNSALKPTVKAHKTGDARVAVDTMLEYGVNPTERGVMKLRGMIDDTNAQIADRIKNSTATINKHDVIPYLKDTMDEAMYQVDPLADVDAVRKVASGFIKHPSLPNDTIPVQTAQKLKQGTYHALRGKYGMESNVALEAQKDLARGLKDKIAEAVPGIGELNALDAKLFKTLDVAERRALVALNNNPAGLTLLAENKKAAAAFLADRSTVFKSLAARMINQAARVPASVQKVEPLLANPVVRSGLLNAVPND